MSTPLQATTASFSAQLPTGVVPVGMLASIHFSGRRIWTFRVAEAQWQSAALTVAWPPALVPHLSGSTTVSLKLDGVPDFFVRSPRELR